jgi:riboflavin kinase/FMN adenylyltransferase
MLGALGVDLLVVQDFTPFIAGTSAVSFVRALIDSLCMAELWVGPDFALGHRREGDVAFLERLGDESGFRIRVIEPLKWKGEVVSSTRIRAALTIGDVAEASGCLGRFYRLAGTVVRGQGLGRELGTPTANLKTPTGRLIPANGVYACLAWVGKDVWRSVVNVGVRPTVGTTRLTVEAHLLGFEGDLYDSELELDFVSRLRDEQAFATLDELVEQIRQDIARAEECFDLAGL